MTSHAGESAAPPKGGGLRVAILVIGGLLLIAGGLLLAAGPLLYRAGSLDLDAATSGTQQNAMYAMAAAGVAGLAGFISAIAGKKQRAAIVGLLLVVAAGVGGGSLYGQTVMRARSCRRSMTCRPTGVIRSPSRRARWRNATRATP